MARKDTLKELADKINRRIKIANTQSEKVRKAAAGAERARSTPRP